MELNIGIGLTNACDLACPHCYRDTDRIELADPYCPLVRGEKVDLEWAPAAERQLLKTGSACTTVLGPA